SAVALRPAAGAGLRGAAPTAAASAAATATAAAAAKPAGEPFPPLVLPPIGDRHPFFKNMLEVMTDLYEFMKTERDILESRAYDKLAGMPARKEQLINIFAESIGNLRARDELKTKITELEYAQLMDASRVIKTIAVANMKLMAVGINAVSTVVESVVEAAKDANPGKIGIYGGDGAIGSSGIETRQAPVTLNEDI
ncbi:hypothetical protein, partial [Caenispirillum bisanense]|uniref:hypothetical protein n=1 Tax=Caenispirillum bisanense TaxID=414052 RepID=UPI0031D34B69